MISNICYFYTIIYFLQGDSVNEMELGFREEFFSNFSNISQRTAESSSCLYSKRVTELHFPPLHICFPDTFYCLQKARPYVRRVFSLKHLSIRRNLRPQVSSRSIQWDPLLCMKTMLIVNFFKVILF